ncbi:TPA: PKD domain-containing protein, partial [Candidatus Peregrinibacteria bacterium]|nr:PKD domain-containing protein [Candidatus Peregrinibacteria bacterium]
TATFEIYSAPENSKYSWDFDGDGIFEIEEGSETKVTYKYANAGIFAVEVWILEAGKEAVIQKREISVRENFRAEIKTQNPIAHFAPEISGNTVYFSSSQSSADENMLNTDISYSWDFGDGFKTEGSNPEHIYKEKGKYTVRLEVEDSLERSTVFSEEISIEEITNEFSADQHGGIQNTETPEISDTQGSVTLTDKDLTDAPDENSSGNSSEENEENNTSPENSGSYAWIWWILILIILIPLIVLIPLLKMKIDDPDKDFSVIFSDFFSGRKKKKTGEDEGGNNDEEQGDDKSNNKDDDKNDDKGRDKSTPLQNTANTATFVDEKIEEQENIRQTIENTESSDIFSGDALGEESNSPENSEDSTPDWMKSYDEESEEKAIEIPETTPIAPIPTPENPNETIPDWLQGGDSPFSDDLPDENLEISETPVAESINLPETSISEEKTPVISTPVKNSDDDIPDWLKADDDEVTPEAEVKTEDVKKEINNKNKEINTVNKRFDKSETLQENSKNPEISESPFSDFDHPEWLNEIKGNEDIQKNIVTETIQAEASSDDDIPDWLKGDDDIISPDSGKTEEVDVDTKNKELDNENKGLNKSEPLQENSEISPVKKKRKRRKKKKPDSKNPENTEKGDHKGTPLPEISTTEENSNENLPDWLKPDTEEISENTSEIPPVKKRRKRRKKKKTPEEIPAIREEIVTPEKILAKDAKIPRQQDDTSEVPEWLKG